MAAGASPSPDSLPHIRILAAICILAACASGYAAVTLAFPGTALDAAWTVNPEGHAGLRSLGPVAVLGMTALSITAVCAGLGVIARRRWAWWIVVIGVTVNGISDLATAIVTGEARTLIGVPIAASVLWWLLREDVRSRFSS